ncbi:MAG TPA: peptidoglycan-binding domain-containing protein [Chthoniobacterales bacterium]
MNRAFLVIAISMVAFFARPLLLQADPLFHSTDPLAARDEYGLLHQNAVLYPPDFERRYHWRPLYYLESGRELMANPAYVGALQAALKRNGYYGGEPDGIFTPEVSDAIARLQKNYSMRVTGRLSIPVRRALFLP